MNAYHQVILLAAAAVLLSGCVTLPSWSATKWANESTSNTFVAGGEEYDASHCSGAVKEHTCYGAITKDSRSQ